jgi:coenzyme F420-reducing hydrogenase delta subunit
MKKDPGTGKTTLNIEKCQVCGLCYSSCPAHAIDTLYYDISTLTDYLKKGQSKYQTNNLVIMCKGSAPDFAGVGEMFGLKQFIPLSVPCVGRVPDEVYMTALQMGLDNIKVLACDEDYCRFERGSAVTGRKIIGLNRILEQLGYGPETITQKRHSLKVKVNADACISCANCVFLCPYHAAKLGDPGVVSFDLSACRGCGLCIAMCPALALDMENWERDRLTSLISRLAAEVKPPSVLVFRCQWAVFPSLNGDMPANVRYIDLPCASRVDKFHIVEAFGKGFSGVIVAACPEDECKQEKSSGKAKHQVELLARQLGQIGLQNNLKFCFVAPRHPDEFTAELEKFCQSVSGAGAKEKK